MITYDLKELIKLTKVNASPYPDVSTCNQVYDDLIGGGGAVGDFSECWAEGPLFGCDVDSVLYCGGFVILSTVPEIQ